MPAKITVKHICKKNGNVYRFTLLCNNKLRFCIALVLLECSVGKPSKLFYIAVRKRKTRNKTL